MPQYTVRTTLDASPIEVFRVLTDARRLRAWSGQSGRVPKQIGGTFSWFDGWASGRVLAYEEGKSLSLTWSISDWPAGTQASIVRIALSGAAKRTTVRINHTGLPSAKESASHKKGWEEYVFGPIRVHLAGRRA
jgi:activator of HSP90 ATPase